MELLKIVLKLLFILATTTVMITPIAFEFFTFRRDKEKKITYKRFRIVIYTAVYVVAITVAMYLLKEVLLWLETARFVQWIVSRIALGGRTVYFQKVMVAMLTNFAIGLLYVFFSKFVRLGLKKKDLVNPKSEDGKYTWAQKVERKIILFFHTETWYFVGRILKVFSATLSIIYILLFIAYQVPAVFGAKWIPYDFISVLFGAGYIYPTITLIAFWEMYFFLEGIKRLEEECPGLLPNDTIELKKVSVDINAIDAEIQKQFKDYFACEVDLSKIYQNQTASTGHHGITEYIGQAIENDARNPQRSKEIYLNCLDKMLENDKSVLINGSFFSEFSMYFLRYLSIVVARGDNVVVVCNNDSQIEEAYQYLKDGLSELSSLYCKDFTRGAVNFDDPIWRIVKIKGESDVIDEAAVDDNSILVTSLSYLCSTHFESQHSRFIHLLDTVVFVDSQNTVNTYNRQLAMLNTKLKHITKNNAALSKNGNVNDEFRVRYMSHQVRYLCFDDTRTPGLDKVLKNLLAVEIETIDSMNYNPGTIVRCYNYEGRVGEDGRRSCAQTIDSTEEIGSLMSVAMLCLECGASNVTIFADESIPYANISETINSNMGRISVKADRGSLRLNSPFYNPDNYSVLVVMDSKGNLPAVLRKYISMVSEKPALIIVFSKPYMMRDYYVHRINELWSNSQIERIPVEEGTKKDVAQKILVKANSGGISEEEILKLCSNTPPFDAFVKTGDVNSILKEILAIYGVNQRNRNELFQFFEYSSSQDFDENGVYCSEDKVLLRRQGKLFDMISGRDMVTMITNDRETVIPLPKNRLTQNYIAGQNLLYNGEIYYINKIDVESGRIYARLAVGGKNDESYRYVQDREYRVERSPDVIEAVFPTKHIILSNNGDDISVSDAFVSVFRAPMEVLTYGYYEVDSHTLAENSCDDPYHCINDVGNDDLAKQTCRVYGKFSNRTYLSESIIKSENKIKDSNGALMMSIRCKGSFGSDVSKTVMLAATMMNELIHSMFPSVADSVVVCPVIHNPISDEESQVILKKQPKITIVDDEERSDTDFELVIVEDCETDLGVVSVLMSAGDNILRTLFGPIFDYLNWYMTSDQKSDYLYYGLDHEPSCFDFSSLHKLSMLLGDDKHDIKLVDLGSIVEHVECDFCGKRYAKGDDVFELDDGRKMCRTCAENLVGNNKKVLKSHLERAKRFLENTYGITLDDDYEFCFESTVKIVNTLKQNRSLIQRGSDAPIKSYIEDKKVHIEYSIPSVNLSELLVRELTHVWQIKHLPNVAEDLAEGHIALVAVQYLKFLKCSSLVAVRTTYYESNDNISGVGYRKLVRALLENPQYHNNPFRYLLEMEGGETKGEIVPPTPRIIEDGDYGDPYVPDGSDRATDGSVSYFYYGRLSATQQKIYDVLLAAIQKHEATVNIEGQTADDVFTASKAIKYDHPELFWYISVTKCGDEMTLDYGATKEESEVLQRRIDEAVPRYLEGITENMSAYDVALRLHAKVIAAVDYDEIALEKEERAGGPADDKIDYLRTICGVFLEGKAVCEGYARAIQYLLQKCGIESAEIAGHVHTESGEEGEGHAWNIVKIDGDYYYLDATWDDSSSTVQAVKDRDLGFDYFCITTEELLRTRDVDLCPTDVPVCHATRANYYYRNGLVIDSYDLEKIKTIAQRAAKNNSKWFAFKCSSEELYNKVFDRFYEDGDDCMEVLKSASKINKQIATNSFTHPIGRNPLWTITVKFKFK